MTHRTAVLAVPRSPIGCAPARARRAEPPPARPRQGYWLPSGRVIFQGRRSPGRAPGSVDVSAEVDQCRASRPAGGSACCSWIRSVRPGLGRDRVHGAQTGRCPRRSSAGEPGAGEAGDRGSPPDSQVRRDRIRPDSFPHTAPQGQGADRILRMHDDPQTRMPIVGVARLARLARECVHTRNVSLFRGPDKVVLWSPVQSERRLHVELCTTPTIEDAIHQHLRGFMQRSRLPHRTPRIGLTARCRADGHTADPRTQQMCRRIPDAAATRQSPVSTAVLGGGNPVRHHAWPPPWGHLVPHGRALWKLTPPWTHRTRPPRPGKRGAFSTSFHRAFPIKSPTKNPERPQNSVGKPG